MLWTCRAKLPAHAPHALAYREPRRRGQGADRPDERAPRSEDEPDGDDDALADAVGGGVEEGAEGRALAARPRECAVEDVEDRADEEDAGAEPVEEDLVPVLEE